MVSDKPIFRAYEECPPMPILMDFVEQGPKSLHFERVTIHSAQCETCRSLVKDMIAVEELALDQGKQQRFAWLGQLFRPQVQGQLALKLGLGVVAVAASIWFMSSRFIGQAPIAKKVVPLVKKEGGRSTPEPPTLPNPDPKPIKPPDVVVKATPIPNRERRGSFIVANNHRPKSSNQGTHLMSESLDASFLADASYLSDQDVTRGGDPNERIKRWPAAEENTNWLISPLEGDTLIPSKDVIFEFAPDRAISRTVELIDSKTTQPTPAAFTTEDSTVVFRLSSNVRLRPASQYLVRATPKYPESVTTAPGPTTWEFRVPTKREQQVMDWAKKHESARPELAAIAYFSIAQFGHANKVAEKIDSEVFANENRKWRDLSLTRWKVIRPQILQAYIDRCNQPEVTRIPKLPSHRVKTKER